ncbi:hypothetical protein FUAX_55900 (plasmid) [Fulvitalea axinellae]|uniref:Phage tail tape measure protein domain-containing protein n=1 Tax=Fulvitalea axinellae TaxID=1182444 RepID=A0AAU9CYX8_9BACT|nr:hypothetical protein FUAX_55900 [Fulvitalea axinellae]
MSQRDDHYKIILDGSQPSSTLKQMRAAASALNKELKELPKNSAEFAKKKKKLQELNKEIRQQTKEMRGLNKETVKGNTAFKKMAGAVKLFGIAIAGMLLIKAGEYFNEAARNARVFEKALSGLSSITGARGRDLEFYAEQAELIGATTTLSAKQAVDAFKLMGSAKPELLKNKEALAEVTMEAIVLAEAAEMELGPATEALAGTLNQYGESAKEASRYTNALAAGSKEGAANIIEETEAIDEFGVAADSYNVKIEESIGLVQTLAEKKLKGAKAGTALRNVLSKMASVEALPPKALEQLEKYGVNLDIVKDKTLPFNVRLREMAKIQNDATALTKVFGQENKIAGEIILGNVDKVERYTKAVTGTTTAYEQQAINTDNYDADLKARDSMYESLSITIGKKLLPSMRSYTKWQTKALKFVKDMVDGHKVAEESYEKQKKKVEGLEGSLTPLISRYKELKNKSKLSAEEQEELRKVIEKIGGIVPTAITKFDDYGKAIGISTEKAEEFVVAERRMMELKHKQAIDEKIKNMEKYERAIQKASGALEVRDEDGDFARKVQRSASKNSLRIKLEFEKLEPEEVAKLQADLATAQGQLNDNLNLRLELAGMKPIVESDFPAVIKAAADMNKRVSELSLDEIAKLQAGFASVTKQTEEEGTATVKAVTEMTIEELHKLDNEEAKAELKRRDRAEESRLARVEEEKKAQEEIAKLKEDFQKRDLEAKRGFEDLKIEAMEEGLEKELAKMNTDFDRKLEKLAEEEDRIKEMKGMKKQERDEFLDQLQEERDLLEAERKAEKEELEAEAKELEREKKMEEMDEDYELESEKLEGHFIRTLATEEERERALLALRKKYLEEKLKALESANLGETVMAQKLRNELEKIDAKELASKKKYSKFQEKLKSEEMTFTRDALNQTVGMLEEGTAARKVAGTAIKAIQAAEITAAGVQEVASIWKGAASLGPIPGPIVGAAQSALAIGRTLVALNKVRSIQYAGGGMTRLAGNMLELTPDSEGRYRYEGNPLRDVGTFAGGGPIGTPSIGVIGEKGPEWVAPAWQLRDPLYAPHIAFLEHGRKAKAFEEGGTTATAEIPETAELADSPDQTATMVDLLREVSDKLDRIPTELKAYVVAEDVRDGLDELDEAVRNSLVE